MTTTALEFLDAILPAEGYKCALVINDKAKFNKFFVSNEALLDFMLRQDALGAAVYHACAVFGTPDSRKQENALGASSFWVDLDAGAGKPYATAVEAASAIHRCVGTFGLPAPLYVGSGNGVHVYWPLTEMVGRREWLRYASGLKSLLLRGGIEADPARTADISSVLRTPGTHNRKHGEYRLVECGPLVGPYEIDRFAVLLEGEKDVIADRSGNNPKPSVGERVIAQGTRGNARSNRPPSIIAAAANIYVDEPRYTEPVVRGCGQLAQLALTRGRMPEPDWYAALGVLAVCVDGAKFAHAWSAGHPTYSVRETDERLARSREFGPTTCAKFENLNPQGCQGCPWKGKITSPIQLGSRQIAEVHGPVNNNVPEENAIVDGLREEAPSKIPQGFSLEGGRLSFTTEGKGGQFVPPEIVAGAAITLESVQTGEINQDFSLSFKLELPQEGERSIILPAATFFGASGLSAIAGQGGVIHNGDLFRKFVRESMDLYNQQQKLERRYDQFGWKDEDTSFLFGGNLYSANGVQPVIGSEELRTRSQYLGPRRNGSLERWRAAANQLFAVGHEVQSFALLASFAAPLMRFHSSGEGGAIVSLVSDRSGTGKTTALEAAASVWGRLKGTQIIDDDTSVAKGLKLGVFGNMACTYDELYNRDPDVIRKFVLMFTNGRDRDRGTADGTLRHVRSEWQTILLLASNSSIVDILSSLDGTDAPAYRVLEFIMDTPTDLAGKRGDQLKDELDKNSGYAADLYLRKLVEPNTLGFIRANLPKWTDMVWQRTGLSKEHRFWVRTIASVIAAGTVVRSAGILDFSMDRIAGWAIEQVKAKLVESKTTTQARDAIHMLVNFLDQHLMDTLVVEKEFRPGPNQGQNPKLDPRRNLLIRHETGTGRIYISEQALKKWLVKSGVNTQGFYADLKAKGVVMQGTRRLTLGAGTNHATGQTTVVEVVSLHPAMSGHVVEVAKLAAVKS